MLICEHSARAIPQALRGLAPPEEIVDSHRGWDIGAGDLARRVSHALDAPLVLQRYSRLVIDCNRPPGVPSSIPVISDHEEISFNSGLTEADRQARMEEIFQPFDRAISKLLKDRKRSAAFSIHSFTPRMDGRDRPWNAGVLTRRSVPTAQALMASLRRQDPSLMLALNEPYQITDDTDWFIPRHAEPWGLPHSLIEIRNDQLRDADGVNRWANLLTKSIADFMEAQI
ncbi:MAG: N-formylglutamate amidohydrolase [Pseudomonadota bacterium]